MSEEFTDELTIEQLAERVGMSVRTVRFYTSRGLVPPPRREGRNGFYGADHIARLELVRELQAHGFTLAAIEKYLEQIPVDATPSQVALHRTLLAPWLPSMAETMDRAELEARAGRPLSDDDLEFLTAFGVVEPTPEDDVFRLASAHLAVSVALLNLNVPIEAAREARRVYTDLGRRAAEELNEVFRTLMWPSIKGAEASGEDAAAVIERLKPLTVAALVSSFEAGVDELKRKKISKHA